MGRDKPSASHFRTVRGVRNRSANRCEGCVNGEELSRAHSSASPTRCGQSGQEPGRGRRDAILTMEMLIAHVVGRRMSRICGDAVLSRSRSFQIEQLFLSLKAPTVACKIAVFPNDAMAGNGDRDAVRGTGSGYGTGSRRLPN